MTTQAKNISYHFELIISPITILSHPKSDTRRWKP